MAENTTAKGVSTDVPSDIDKRAMFPLWYRNQEWRDDLHKKCTHKALDMLNDDEMNFTQTKTGASNSTVVGVAAAAGVPTALLAAMLVWNMTRDDASQAAPPAAMPVVSGPIDSEYNVRFYNAKGELIEVPHISTMPP